MIIERLDLTAFGRFSDESLDFSAGPRRFHLVYGPNESGKSTCMRAIGSLFFGMPRTLSDDFVHPYKNLRVGATLSNELGERIKIVRRKSDKNSLYEEDDKTRLSETVLSQMLGGIDQQTFSSRFGLSHEELVAGGKIVIASKGELGEILFAAGAGVGRLKAIQSELETESKNLFLERGKKTINLLLKELDEKRKELRELQTPPAAYRSLMTQLEEAESRSQTLAEELSATNQKLAKRKAFREALKIVPVWKRDKARLAELASVPKLDQDFAARRRESAANRQTYEKLVGDLRRELGGVEKNLSPHRLMLRRSKMNLKLFRCSKRSRRAERHQMIRSDCTESSRTTIVTCVNCCVIWKSALPRTPTRRTSIVW